LSFSPFTGHFSATSPLHLPFSFLRVMSQYFDFRNHKHWEQQYCLGGITVRVVEKKLKTWWY